MKSTSMWVFPKAGFENTNFKVFANGQVNVYSSEGEKVAEAKVVDEWKLPELSAGDYRIELQGQDGSIVDTVGIEVVKGLQMGSGKPKEAVSSGSEEYSFLLYSDRMEILSNSGRRFLELGMIPSIVQPMGLTRTFMLFPPDRGMVRMGIYCFETMRLVEERRVHGDLLHDVSGDGFYWFKTEQGLVMISLDPSVSKGELAISEDSFSLNWSSVPSEPDVVQSQFSPDRGKLFMALCKGHFVFMIEVQLKEGLTILHDGLIDATGSGVIMEKQGDVVVVEDHMTGFVHEVTGDSPMGLLSGVKGLRGVTKAVEAHRRWIESGLDAELGNQGPSGRLHTVRWKRELLHVLGENVATIPMGFDFHFELREGLSDEKLKWQYKSSDWSVLCCDGDKLEVFNYSLTSSKLVHSGTVSLWIVGEDALIVCGDSVRLLSEPMRATQAIGLTPPGARGGVEFLVGSKDDHNLLQFDSAGMVVGFEPVRLLYSEEPMGLSLFLRKGQVVVYHLESGGKGTVLDSEHFDDEDFGQTVFKHIQRVGDLLLLGKEYAHPSRALNLKTLQWFGVPPGSVRTARALSDGSMSWVSNRENVFYMGCSGEGAHVKIFSEYALDLTEYTDASVSDSGKYLVVQSASGYELFDAASATYISQLEGHFVDFVGDDLLCSHAANARAGIRNVFKVDPVTGKMIGGALPYYVIKSACGRFYTELAFKTEYVLASNDSVVNCTDHEWGMLLGLHGLSDISMKAKVTQFISNNHDLLEVSGVRWQSGQWQDMEPNGLWKNCRFQDLFSVRKYWELRNVGSDVTSKMYLPKEMWFLNDIVFSPDGTHIVAVGKPHGAGWKRCVVLLYRIQDLVQGAPLEPLDLSSEGGNKAIWNAHFLKKEDGNLRFIFSNSDAESRVYNVTKGKWEQVEDVPWLKAVIRGCFVHAVSRRKPLFAANDQRYHHMYSWGGFAGHSLDSKMNLYSSSTLKKMGAIRTGLSEPTEKTIVQAAFFNEGRNLMVRLGNGVIETHDLTRDSIAVQTMSETMVDSQ